MSVDAGIFIKFEPTVNPVDLLHAIFRAHWVPNSKDVTHLPAGDNGDYLWTSAPEHVFWDVARQKAALREPIGVRLFYQGTHHGGEFLLLQDQELVLSPTVNRATLHDGRTSDVSWYLERLLPIFEGEGGARVHSWQWRETT